MNLKLGLKRVSQLPNANRQFCYHIVSGNTTGIAGVVTRDDEQRMFWSFTRKGTLNKEFNVTVDTRKVGDKNYINLTDNSAESIGEVGYMAGIAERAGLDRTAVHTAAANRIFSNEVTKATPINQPTTTEQPAKEEQPVEEKAQAGASVETGAEA